jgi:hypothetical protein
MCQKETVAGFKKMVGKPWKAAIQRLKQISGLNLCLTEVYS